MRILLPHLTPFPSSEAPAVQVANMAQAFAELGHTVTLVAPAPPPVTAGGDRGSSTDRSEGLAPESLARRFGFVPRFTTVVLSQRLRRGQSLVHALRTDRLVRRLGIDLVYSRSLRACLLPALRGVPTVFEAHTLVTVARWPDRWIVRRLLLSRGFRGIVAISGLLRDDLVAVLGVPPARLHVAHDGVRIIDAQPAPSPMTTTERLRVGYTGSLFPGKGVEWIVAAAPLCPWAEFHVAGGPSARAQALAARCAADPTLANVVVHGELPPSDAIDLQRRMDVLVAPFSRRIESNTGVDISRWTSPMKLFEYMVSGRPIVVSDLPVLREVLRPDVEALMVEPESTDALVAALIRLRDDAGLRQRLADAAASRAREEFTWSARAHAILVRFSPGAVDLPAA
jgi:glycosyltransferase involved in cell wall biosynthesis